MICRRVQSTLVPAITAPASSESVGTGATLLLFFSKEIIMSPADVTNQIYARLDELGGQVRQLQQSFDTVNQRFSESLIPFLIH